MSCKVYSPNEVRVIVNGVDIVGFAKDDKISIEPLTEDIYETEVGIDGEVEYIENHDERHMLKLILQQGSPSNPFLESLLKTKVCFAVSVENARHGKFIGGSIDCKIVKRPKYNFGKSVKDREWAIMMPRFAGSTLPE